MSQSEQNNLSAPTLSITNFDLPSLHLLHSEIIVTLKNAEIHLSDFNDHQTQAPLLLDSVEVLTQLSRIFELISLKGGQILSLAIAQGLQQLHDTNDNSNIALIMDLSEAIMTLDRYVEFVLLTETVEPSLLLPIINKLQAYGNDDSIDNDYFASFGSSSVIIANPEQNFQSLDTLGLDSQLLTNVYRNGLGVLLVNNNGEVSESESKKLQAMSAACTLIAGHSNSLFWQAAAAAITDIETLLPLSLSQKHTLIYLEQQFNSYLPVMDIRFADLVSFACSRDNEQALELRKQYANNQLNSAQREQMKRFLFGPNRAITDISNDLIQQKINIIKEQVDSYARVDAVMVTPIKPSDIAANMLELRSTLSLLGLSDTAALLTNAADAVANWHNPDPTDFDNLLLALMAAENASIAMAKAHTPGAINLTLNNNQISLHQLDTAYDVLVKESRGSIIKTEQAIINYQTEDNADLSMLAEMPEMLRQVAGALRFLELPALANMFSQLATFTQNRLNIEQPLDSETLSLIADVLMSVDYRLSGFENNRPVNKRSLDVGQHSLSLLLAA